MQDVRSSINYDQVQLWLHADCNQNASKRDLACLLDSGAEFLDIFTLASNRLHAHG